MTNNRMEFLSHFTIEELVNPVTSKTITEKLEQIDGNIKVTDYARRARYEMEVNNLIIK